MKVYTVKSAQKDDPSNGIKKGDTYYWWKFRYGGKRKSKTYPKPQDLTQSSFWKSVYDIQDSISGLTADDTLPDEVEAIKNEIESLRSEVEDALSNIPEQLQDSHMLNERLSEIESWLNELEGIGLEIEDVTEEDIKDDIEDDKAMTEEKRKKAIEEAIENKIEELWQEKLEEIQSCEYQGS